jgi:hypothetical protein
MLPEPERRQHLFIVRVWCEPGRTPAECQWRGSVEHVPSGDRRYFAARGDLARFLLARLGEAGWGLDSSEP